MTRIPDHFNRIFRQWLADDRYVRTYSREITLFRSLFARTSAPSHTVVKIRPSIMHQSIFYHHVLVVVIDNWVYLPGLSQQSLTFRKGQGILSKQCQSISEGGMEKKEKPIDAQLRSLCLHRIFFAISLWLHPTFYAVSLKKPLPRLLPWFFLISPKYSALRVEYHVSDEIRTENRQHHRLPLVHYSDPC